MAESQLNVEGERLLGRAAAEATSRGSAEVTTTHLLLALTTSGDARDWLQTIVDVHALRRAVAESDASRSPDAANALAAVAPEAPGGEAPRLWELRVVGVLAGGQDVAGKALRAFGVTVETVRHAVESGEALRILSDEATLSALRTTTLEDAIVRVVADVCPGPVALGGAVLRHVSVRKNSTAAEIELQSSNPGHLLGEGGARLDELAKRLERALGVSSVRVRVLDDRGR